MGAEKRVFLICDKEKAMVSICQSVIDKYKNARLYIYYGQEDISTFLHKNSGNVNADSDTLIMIDASNSSVMTTEECVHEFRSDRILRNVPVLVLINEVDKDVMQSCFDNYVSCFVLKTEDQEGMTYIFNHIFDYWYKTNLLPKYTMPDPSLLFDAGVSNLSFEL